MLDEQRLRQLYIVEQRSIRAIAALEQVPIRTIYDALTRYRIPRRSLGFRTPQASPADGQLDPAELRRLYVDEQLSIRAIAERAGVSTRTVYDLMVAHRVPRRTRAQPRPPAPELVVSMQTIDAPTLRRLYEGERRSIADIATQLHCSPSLIRRALVRWGIARRRRGRPGAPR